MSQSQSNIPNKEERLADLAARRAQAEQSILLLQMWFSDPDNVDLLAEFAPGDLLFAEIESNDWEPQYAGIVREVCLEPAPKFATSSVEPKIYYEFERDPAYPYSSNTRSSGGCSLFYGKAHYQAYIDNEIRLLKHKLENPATLPKSHQWLKDNLNTKAYQDVLNEAQRITKPTKE